MVALTDVSIPFIDYEINPSTLLEDAKSLAMLLFPSWSSSSLELKELCDGITNKLVLVTCGSEKILIRSYGLNTSIIIDRERELSNMIKLSMNELSKSPYAKFRNGIVYGFAEGSVFTVSDMRDPHKSKLVARKLSVWHRLPCEPIPLLFPTIKKWLDVLPAQYSSNLKQVQFFQSGLDLQTIRSQLNFLQSRAEAIDSPVVFCHNDLLSGNIIYNPEIDDCAFVDYEYGTPSYRGFDIANHFCEYAGFDCDWSKYPDREYQIEWFKHYLGTSDMKEIKKLEAEVEFFTMAAHLFWGVWALIQTEFSDIDFDYLGYGIMRLEQYFIRKELYLQSHQ